jgi:hypothetical protein
MLIKRFDERICLKNNCPYMSNYTKLPACFGNPNDCEINKKAGYPKEVEEK